MSTPPTNVPYQAYRSKRHSRTPSNIFVPNVSPPPVSRVPTTVGNGYPNGNPTSPQHRPRLSLSRDSSAVYETEKPSDVLGHIRSSSVPPNLSPAFVDSDTVTATAEVAIPMPPRKVEGPVPVYAPYVPTSGGTSPAMSPPPQPQSLGISPTDTNVSPASSISPAPSTPPVPAQADPQMEVKAPSPVPAHTRAIPSISLTLNGDGDGHILSVDTSHGTQSTTGPFAIPPSLPPLSASPVALPPVETSTSAPSTTPAPPSPIIHKTSSFRHVPRVPSTSGGRTVMPSSPLRPSSIVLPPHSHHSLASSISMLRQEVSAQPQRSGQTRSRFTSLSSLRSLQPQTYEDRNLPSIHAVSSHPHPNSQSHAHSHSHDSTHSHSDRIASPSPQPRHPQPQSHARTTFSHSESQPVSRTNSIASAGSKPPPKPYSPALSPSPAGSVSPIAPSPAISPTPSQSGPSTHVRSPHAPSHGSAPYRAGFQPKGVWRPLTEDFMLARSAHLDVGRVERTKLERRLEKLVALHFPPEGVAASGTGTGPRVKRPAPGGENRRASFFFDLDFRNMDAGELWKGVLQSQAMQGGKGEIRAAEQRITPWQDDASVSKCPICVASFHTLTNRKHHCRLCGQIICSLPIKRPQRPETCSLLFIVDPKTRRIEEVGEGVDYGVRRRRTSSMSSPGRAIEEVMPEEEKFLKGVRICRQCRPILQRQQYHQEVAHVPTFTRLYEVFISLEKEIEDSLPQFQELILSLSNDDQPTKEASAARKRLLEAFSQYDALSKRILKIPCPGGKGSSQDRVQLAILSRANLFLQKNMFPLQSLPKPKIHKSSSKSSAGQDADNGPLIDPDSAVAHALQPLLEQEALLESFVEEAKAHRKFEDAKTLRNNLEEIRAEIDRIMGNAKPQTGGKAKASSRR